MEWLLQNWLWIVVAIGGVWLFSRMSRGTGMMGGRGHDMAHEGPPQDTAAKAAGDKDAKPASSSHRHSGGCC
jgi:hypothetical protein